MFPVDFHCHGVGKFDFTEPENLLLEALNRRLQIEGIYSILTLYLPYSKIGEFESLLKTYHEGRANGSFANISGIALEGPLLSSFGGTPEQGCWSPTEDEWNRLFALGQFGLKYIVVSPDYEKSAGEVSIKWIIERMIASGILPALGHFRKDNPKKSAMSINSIVEYIGLNNFGPIITDHLYNDMPLNFNHAYRSKADRQDRSSLMNVVESPWTEKILPNLLGEVPAAIIAGAKKGAIKICLNFDGDHVDLELCKKTVEYVGSENILVMTDRIQSKVLAGQVLRESSENTLLYQKEGVVAGGTQSLMRQILNMLSVGICSKDIENIAVNTPKELLDRSQVKYSCENTDEAII